MNIKLFIKIAIIQDEHDITLNFIKKNIIQYNKISNIFIELLFFSCSDVGNAG